MTEDTDLFFGTAHVRGAEAIKAVFVKIDEPRAYYLDDGEPLQIRAIRITAGPLDRPVRAHAAVAARARRG
ncbi:hypothetical protein [Nonomuraea guangzhouensis]|uniref:Uncharacterized protein n=1 Tax=Nonomuraea guangzhouensis TaxID=1291555 RepID=A0ABW4GU28_9ACTN|nr:hypothetical protein [Nonomuraea guangzhouensis]